MKADIVLDWVVLATLGVIAIAWILSWALRPVFERRRENARRRATADFYEKLSEHRAVRPAPNPAPYVPPARRPAYASADLPAPAVYAAPDFSGGADFFPIPVVPQGAERTWVDLGGGGHSGGGGAGGGWDSSSSSSDCGSSSSESGSSDCGGSDW